MLVLFLSGVAAIELFRALPLLSAFHELAACGQRAMRLIPRGGCSERNKERAMQLLARRMFVRSFQAGGLLLAVASPILLVLWVSRLPGAAEAGIDAGWTARLSVLPFVALYSVIRSRLRSRQGRRVQPR